MKNLEKFGVQELGTQEMKNVNGGGIFLLAVLLGVIVGAAFGIGECIEK